MTEVTDQFTNLTNWELAESACIVATSNKVWGTAKTLPVAVNTTAFEPGSGGNFRVVGSITYQSGGTEAKTASIGVSNTAKASEYEGAILIGIDGKGNAYFNKGITGTKLIAGLTTGTYLATIVGDSRGISLALVKTDRSVEVSHHITVAEGGTVKRVMIWNFDSRGSTTGNSISPIGAITSLSTLATRTNIEGIGTSRAYQSLDAGGHKIRLEFPTAYETSKAPKAWLLFSHGSLEGDLQNVPIERENITEMFKAIVEAGYCVASSEMGGASTFGNKTANKCLLELYEYIHSRYSTVPILLFSFSAGGLPTCCAIKENLFPIAGALMISPFIALEEINGTKKEIEEDPFGAVVEAAYELTPANGPWTNWKEKVETPELIPFAYTTSQYRALPIGLMASPEDTTAIKAKDAEKLRIKLEGHQVFLKENITSGTHGSAGQFPTTSTVTLLGEILAASGTVSDLMLGMVV